MSVLDRSVRKLLDNKTRCLDIDLEMPLFHMWTTSRDGHRCSPSDSRSTPHPSIVSLAKMRFSSRSRSSCRLCFAAPVPSTPNLILAASADPVIRLGTERGWKLHYRPWLLRHLFLASPGFTRKNSFDILSEVVFKILSTSLFQPLKFCLSCFFHWEVFGSWLPDITFLRGCFFIGI